MRIDTMSASTIQMLDAKLPWMRSLSLSSLSCDFASLRAARKFGKDNASWQQGAHHWHFIGTRRTCSTGINAEELALILAQLLDLHAIASSI
jgi:hypothetical protein